MMGSTEKLSYTFLRRSRDSQMLPFSEMTEGRHSEIFQTIWHVAKLLDGKNNRLDIVFEHYLMPRFLTEFPEYWTSVLSPHFHFHNDRSLSSNKTREAASHWLEDCKLLSLQNHDEAHHFLPRG